MMPAEKRIPALPVKSDVKPVGNHTPARAVRIRIRIELRLARPYCAVTENHSAAVVFRIRIPLRQAIAIRVTGLHEVRPVGTDGLR